MRSFIHKKQTARMEYRKLESRDTVRPSALALHPSIAAEDQPVSVRRLELNANVHPSSLDLLPAIAIGDQLDPVENLPDDPQWHPSRPRETYMDQQRELLQEMDSLVTQYKKDHESPASQTWLLGKMRGFLIASKSIREERINIIKVLTDTAKDKARQEEEMMKMDVNKIPESRCASHGHHGARRES